MATMLLYYIQKEMEKNMSYQKFNVFIRTTPVSNFRTLNYVTHICPCYCYYLQEITKYGIVVVFNDVIFI